MQTTKSIGQFIDDQLELQNQWQRNPELFQTVGDLIHFDNNLKALMKQHSIK